MVNVSWVIKVIYISKYKNKIKLEIDWSRGNVKVVFRLKSFRSIYLFYGNSYANKSIFILLLTKVPWKSN
jgi:hypothetical protein